MLIGITGKAGAGKDTIAKLITGMVSWSDIYHLADPVKAMALAIDPIVDVGIEPDGKTICIARLSHIIEHYGPEVAKSMPEVRRLYQRVGTEAGRGIFGEECWIDLMMERYYEREPFTTLVVPDVRFKNEAFAVQNVSGKIIRVVRPDATVLGANATHASETEQDGIDPDVTICNDGDIKQLRGRVRDVLEGWGVWRP